MKRDILAVLADKWEDGTRPADLYAGQIAARPRDYLDAILAGLASKNKRVQGGCAELASLLSASARVCSTTPPTASSTDEAIE
jgi:hypothetical protein